MKALFWPAMALSVTPFGAGPSLGAEIRVMSGGAPQAALTVLASDFEKSTGHKVNLTFAVVSAIQQRVAAGERADVVLLPGSLIDAMDKAGTLGPTSRMVLARVGVAVVTRQGAVQPDIQSPEGVRRTLLQARSIVHPDPSATPSGAHITRMLAQLGIASDVKSKLILKNAIDGGAAMVAKGEAEIGMFLVSEVLPVKGIAVAGLLPPTLQSFIVYAAAIPATSGAPEAASDFLKFVSGAATAEQWKAAGFELLGGS